MLILQLSQKCVLLKFGLVQLIHYLLVVIIMTRTINILVAFKVVLKRLLSSLSLVGCLLLVIIGIWTLADKTFLSGMFQHFHLLHLREGVKKMLNFRNLSFTFRTIAEKVVFKAKNTLFGGTLEPPSPLIRTKS